MDKSISGKMTLYDKYRRELSSGVTFGVVASLILLILAVAILSVNYVFIKVKVSGSSMLPTLVSGDVVMVNSYDKPDYGDIIVISGEKDNGDWLIKRAIAFGGDSVKIEGGYVYLKKSGNTEFEKISEPYLGKQGITFYPNVSTSHDASEHVWEVESGCVFYLGDNRQNSHDSRADDFGTCKENQIVGVVGEFALRIKGVNNFFDKISQTINGFFTGKRA